MNLDDCLNLYFENDERYADLLNGSIFKGKQVVRPEDLLAMDTKAPGQGTKTQLRDHLRRVAFDTSFAIISLENQSRVDYKMPLRCMDYEVREYQRQARRIARRIRKPSSKVQVNIPVSSEEYLSGFGREDKLYPCVTIVLFFGNEWNGSRSLYEMMDFSDIPEELKEYIQDYRMNLIPIRQISDFNLYHSDLRQVFEMVSCADDRKRMQEVLSQDSAYKHMEEDAADLIAELVHMPEIREKKTQKGEKVNMCKAIYEMIEEGREEGREEGKLLLIHNLMHNLNKTAEAAMDLLGIPSEEQERYLTKL